MKLFLRSLLLFILLSSSAIAAPIKTVKIYDKDGTYRGFARTDTKGVTRYFDENYHRIGGTRPLGGSDNKFYPETRELYNDVGTYLGFYRSDSKGNIRFYDKTGQKTGINAPLVPNPTPKATKPTLKLRGVPDGSHLDNYNGPSWGYWWW